jgi:hypothetical protein
MRIKYTAALATFVVRRTGGSQARRAHAPRRLAARWAPHTRLHDGGRIAAGNQPP